MAQQIVDSWLRQYLSRFRESVFIWGTLAEQHNITLAPWTERVRLAFASLGTSQMVPGVSEKKIPLACIALQVEGNFFPRHPVPYEVTRGSPYDQKPDEAVA